MTLKDSCVSAFGVLWATTLQETPLSFNFQSALLVLYIIFLEHLNRQFYMRVKLLAK